MNKLFYKLLIPIFVFLFQSVSNAQTDTVYLSFVSNNIDCGQTKGIKMQVKNFKNVVTLNFTLRYNKSILKLNSFSGISAQAKTIANSTTFSDISTGNTFSWDGKGTGVTLTDGDAFEFLFSPVAESGGLTDTLKFSNMPTSIKVEVLTTSGKKNAVVKTTNAQITVVDNFPPVLKCPDFKFVRIGVTEDSTTVNKLNPDVSDPLCGKAFIDYTLTGATLGMGLDQDATGKIFNVGITNVRYTAHDNANNTSECQFQVLVSKTDSILLYTSEPLVKCSDSTFTVETRVANFNNVTSFDMDVNFPPNVVKLKSIQQLNATVNSSNPNFVSSTFANQGLIKVAFTNTAGITLPDTSVLLYSLTFKKIKGSDKVQLEHNNIEALTTTSGTNTVPVSVLSNPITIIDKNPPVIKCPKDTSFYLTALGQTTVQAFGISAMATDNCELQPINYTGIGATTIPNTINIDGKIFNIGKTTIVANAKDYAKNLSECQYNVYVRQPKVTTSNEIVDCKADTVGFALKVSDFIDIKKLTTRLQWNVDSLEYLYTTYTTPFIQGTNIGHNALSNNLLINFSATQTNGLTVADNQTMANVFFKIKDKTLGKKYKVTTQVSNIEVGTNNTAVYGTGANGHVSILDTKGPNIINCPNDITIRQDKCVATHSWTKPTATDDCSTATLFDTNAPSNSKATIEANIKPTVFHYTFKDDYNNKTTCTFKVTVLDTIKPSITNCDTSTITLPTNDLLANCSAVLNNSYLPNITDNCDFKITTTLSIGDTIRRGAPVNYIITVKDSSGNVATCARKIVVRDATGPKFDGNFFSPPTKVLDNEAGKCGATYTWTAPTATDNCDGTVNVTSDIPSGTFFPIGTTKVNFRAFDKAGNPTVETLNIVVIDKERPKFVDCPNNNKDTIIYITTGCDVEVNTPIVLYTDNCVSGIQAATLKPGEEPIGKRYPKGTTTLVYLTADPSALPCYVNIIVKDTIKPSITCPKDTILNANSLCVANFILPNPIFSDNCGTPIVTPSTTQIQFPVGITPVTYTARDGSDNTTTCNFNITVKDNTAPSIVDCPADITAETDQGVDFSYASWTDPTATDNCTNQDSIKLTPNYSNGGTEFKIGTTTVTYTAMDKSGNTTTCSFKVTVLDKEKPVIKNCPPDSTFKIFGSTCDARFSVLESFKITDNHRIVSIDSTGTNANIRYRKGTYNFSFTAKDSSGNEGRCSFRLTFIDAQVPIASNCQPTQGPFDAPTGSCEATLKLSDLTFPNFADNCDAIVTAIDTIYKENGIWKKGLPTDLKFKVGQTLLGVVAKDSANNVSDTCFINIVVNGTLKPTLSGCQKDTTVYVSSGCSQKMTFKAPTFTLGCAAKDTAYYNYADGYDFAISKNPYKIKYFLRDKNGAIDSCSFNLTVKDSIKPVITITGSIIKQDVIELISNNCKDAILPPNAIKIVAEDLPCAINIAKIDTSVSLSNPFNIGTTIVIFTATDTFGNKITKTISVTVKDTISNITPKISINPNSKSFCPGDTVMLSVDSLTGFVTTWKTKSGIIKTGNSIKITASDEYSVSYINSTCTSKSSSASIEYTPALIVVKDEITLKTNTKDSANILRNDGASNVLVTWNTTGFTSNIGTITTKSNGDFTITSKNIAGTYKIPYKICSIDCPDLCSEDTLTVNIIGTTPTDCKVPNLVTPNADGYNDNLVIDCISNATTGAKIYIYSQWGELVYSSVDYRNDWDATWKGKNLPDGTYFYVFQLNSTAEEKKGYITVFR